MFPWGHSPVREIRVCLAITTPFFRLSGSSSDLPVAFCSSSYDPSFLKFLIFNQIIGKFFEFCCSKSPFFAEFQLFTSKMSLKLPLFSRPIFAKKSALYRPRREALNTPTHFKSPTRGMIDFAVKLWYLNFVYVSMYIMLTILHKIGKRSIEGCHFL